MDPTQTVKADTAGQDLVITRLLDAPRELVFRVWTETEQLMRWWGPSDFATRIYEWDLRPGGVWQVRMRSPEGKDYWQQGVFHEIVGWERLVFSFIWAHEPGPEMTVTVKFAERDGKTEMTFRKGPFKSVALRESEEEGWSESFDRLEEHVNSRGKKQAPRPGPEHERLEVFVGKWVTEGRTRAGRDGPAIRVSAVDTYEWLPGRFFLVHRVDGRMGDDAFKTMEIIGHDAATGMYPMHYFDSRGNTGEYQASVRDGTWTFTGEKERATVVFADGGNTMNAHWERSSDGAKWQPWMDVKLTKDQTVAGR